jgi:hypothetical protein
MLHEAAQIAKGEQKKAILQLDQACVAEYEERVSALFFVRLPVSFVPFLSFSSYGKAAKGLA